MEIITQVLAIWAAIISTVLAVVELRRNKPQVTIVFEKVDYVEIINMNVTNSGARTLTLTGFEIVFVNQRGEIAPVEVPPKQNHFHETVREYPFPITLAVGEQVSLTLSEHLASPLMLGEYGARIRLHDSEGRVYTKYSTRSYNPRWGSYSKYSFLK